MMFANTLSATHYCHQSLCHLACQKFPQGLQKIPTLRLTTDCLILPQEEPGLAPNAATEEGSARESQMASPPPSLPNDIIVKAFRCCTATDLLTTAALVSKQWNTDAAAVAASSVHLNLKSEAQSEAFAHWLSKRSCHLESLSLKSWGRPPHEIPRCPALLAALAPATQLQSLSLLGFDMSYRLLHLAPLTALRRLSLRSCRVSDSNILPVSNNTLLLHLTALKKLQHLDLARNPIRGDGRLFGALGRELPELTSLAVSNGPELRESALADISEAMPQLQQLDLKEGFGLSPAAVVRYIGVPCQKLGMQAGRCPTPGTAALEMEQQQLMGWLGMYGHHLQELVVMGHSLHCFSSAVTSVLQSLAVQTVPSAADATPATAAAAPPSSSLSSPSSTSSSSSAAAAAAGLRVHPAPAAGAAAGDSRSAQLQLPLMQLRELEIRWHGAGYCHIQHFPFALLTVLTGLTKLGLSMPNVDRKTLRTIAEIKSMRELDFTGSRHVDDRREEGRRRGRAVRGVIHLRGLTGLTTLVFPAAWVKKGGEEWRLEGRVAEQLQQMMQNGD